MDGQAAKHAADSEEPFETAEGHAADGLEEERNDAPEVDEGDQFIADLRSLVEQAYPDLLCRVKNGYFADWHRLKGAEVELAHAAVAAVMDSAIERRKLPNNTLAYLVTAAKHVASKDWHLRSLDPLARSTSDPTQDISDPAAVRDKYGEEQSAGEATLPKPQSPVLGVFSSIVGLPEQPELVAAVQKAEALAARDAIEKLPRRQRQVFCLYIEKGSWYTQRQLAAQIGISEKNFQMMLTRAGKTVCEEMRSQGFDVLERPDWGDVG